MNPLIQEKLSNLPKKPGVYQHKDAKGTVLYVGKAKNLRSRVRSYFQDSRPREGRLQILINKIVDFDVIVTDTEAEALILENNLIKQLKPRYNINLKDDKTFPFICIPDEPFPRVFPTRKVRRDGSLYYGPYTDVKNMKLMLQTIRSIFQLRTCTLNLAPEPIAAGKSQICLEYHINKCAGPCVGYIEEQEYDRTIDQVKKLLDGHNKSLIRLLRDEMAQRSAELKFEEAADLRNRIHALEKYSQKQKIVSKDVVDRDLFALEMDREEDVACGVLFKVREGTVVGRQYKYLRRIEGNTQAALMQSFLENYYLEAMFFPDEILLTTPAENPEPLEVILQHRKQKKVPIKVPKRGDKADLMNLVETNARLLLQEWKVQQVKRGEDRVPFILKSLQKDLRMHRLPRRIECFDISHLGGTGTVASCIVFENGKPLKSAYRHFKIKSVSEGKTDDFQAMREVVERRYWKTQEENGPWPDLVVIDGGKGQLSSAVEAMEKLEVYGKFPIIGLAKRLEEVYYPGDTDPLLISKTSASLQLLQRIRNEAHRFAITFQRKQRTKKTIHTELLNIPGVGEKTVRKLLRAFGSVKRVRASSKEDMAEVVGRALADKIIAFYHTDKAEPSEKEHRNQ